MDYVYTLEHGKIVEAGTYSQLLSNRGPFSRLMIEFGGEKEEKEEEEQAEEEEAIDGDAQGDKQVIDAIEEKKLGRKPELRKRMSSVRGKPANLAEGTGKKEVRTIYITSWADRQREDSSPKA